MGTGISANYDDIFPLFNTSCWKVHNAVNKTTREPVSLWQLDYDIVQKNGTKSERERFLNLTLSSVQQMRRLHHPQILKVVEASENIKALDFAAEPISSCLAYEDSFSPDDASYIGFQVASVMQFLSKDARIVMFGLSTSGICLTKSMNVKISVFQYAAAMVNDMGGSIPRQGDFKLSPFQPNLNFCAPEYTQCRQGLNYMVDLFSFGCIMASIILNRNAFDCATPDEFARAISVPVPVKLPPGVSQDMADLIKGCLDPVPDRRWKFEQIVGSKAFQSLPLRSLQYMDMIMTKSKEDKYRFFKGLTEILPCFSLRLLQSKLLPAFINELLLEPLFGTVLVPLIMEIGRSLDSVSFYQEVFLPLSGLMIKPEPPECMLAVLHSMPIIINRIEDGKHYDLCYPIFAAALSTNVSQLHREALLQIPLMLSKMNTETIDTAVVPALIDLFSVSDDVKVVCSCIMSLANCLPKLDHNSFSERVVPRITAAWNRLHYPAELAEAAMYVIERIKPSLTVAMRDVVAMASEVLGCPDSPAPIQLQLCEYIKNTTERYVKERTVVSAPGSWLTNKKKKPAAAAQQNLSMFESGMNRSSATSGRTFSTMRKAAAPVQHINPEAEEFDDDDLGLSPASVTIESPPAHEEQESFAEMRRQSEPPSMFAGMKTNARKIDPAKRASSGASMFSGMKMGGS